MEILQTDDVPQADRLEKVLRVAWLAVRGLPLSTTTLELTDRHVSYYVRAAQILGLIDDANCPTALAREFDRLDDRAQLQRVAIGFSQSVVCRRWVAWAGAESPIGLAPETASAFLESQTRLAPATAARRAGTLKRWLRDLAEHLQAMHDTSAAPPTNPVELLQAVFRAIEDLRALDPVSAQGAHSAINSKPLGALSHQDLEDLRTQIARLRKASKQADDSRSYVERDYGLFLDAIPRGRALLRNVESLAVSSNFDDLVQRSESIFVDQLGYTRARLDETDRTSRSELSRIEKIGSFGELDIVCVQLSRQNWYAAFYEIVFRFHPYSLILSLEPNATALRFVYREGPSKRPQYRCLTGRQSDWEPNDNLLVWAWRLHELRPRIGETAQNLQRRVHRALALSPEDIGTEWPSTEIDASQPIPGIAWEDAPRRAFESFLQLGCSKNERRRWGLHAVVADRFPLSVARNESVRVVCRDYQIGPEPPTTEQCLDAGSSRERVITLLLEIDCTGEVQEFALECRLPEPDQAGRFVLNGVQYAFAARVQDDGRLTALSDAFAYALADEQDDAEPEDVVDGEESDSDDDVDALADAGATKAASTPEDADEAEQQPSVRGFRGLSPRAFYEYAVSRKLAGLAFILWRTHLDPNRPTPEQIVSRILRFGRREHYLPLAATTVFRRFLIANEESACLRAETWQVAASPPAWVCLDSSSVLECGSLQPVAAARMHPTGSLAIPVQGGPGVRMSLIRGSATDANPRARSGAALVGPPEWWIAPGLRRFAALGVGSIEAPLAAKASVPMQLRIASRQGAERRVWLRDSLELPRLQPLLLRRLVPGKEPPTFLVSLGASVEPGSPWLEIHAGAWSATSEFVRSPEEELALQILKNLELSDTVDALQRDPRLIERIPPTVSGVVSDVCLKPVLGALGIRRGWMARIEVRRPARHCEGVMHGSDGCLYPVAGALGAYDMPFDIDGHPFDAIVERPEAPQEEIRLTDGATGDELFGASIALSWAHRARNDVPPDAFLRYRAIDGEGISSHTSAPSLTEYERLRWLVLDSAGAQLLLESSSPSYAPCWAPRFQQAASAVGVALTADLVVASSKPAVHEYEIHDPTASRLDKRLESPPPGAARRLPVAVVHPWRRAAAAALLGLTASELDHVIELHGASVVTAAIRQSAGASPSDAALRRMAQAPDRQTKAQVGYGLHRLQKLPTAAVCEMLVLEAIPVPSPELIPFGLPPGAEQLLRTPLLRRYRQIELACKMVEAFAAGPEPARLAAECELQRTVDALFGPRVDSAPLGHDLAGMLMRLWPFTRPQSLRFATSKLALRRTHQGSAPFVCNDQSPVHPPVNDVARAPADAGWWRERAARHHLCRDRLPWFIGLFASLDVAAGPARLDLDPDEESLGEWAAREWLRRCEHPDSRPARLLKLLENPVPTQLPADLSAARALLDPILSDAIPGRDSAAKKLQEVLAQILSGFWLLPPTEAAVLGWTWGRPSETPTAKSRRCVPPFTSTAWLLWPCIEQATSAPQLLLDVEEGRPTSTLLRTVAGFRHHTTLDSPISIKSFEPSPTPVAGAPVLIEEPHAQQQPPSIAAPLPSDEDVMVAKQRLRQWLIGTRTPENTIS